jgi:hypothetical protein
VHGLPFAVIAASIGLVIEGEASLGPPGLAASPLAQAWQLALGSPPSHRDADFFAAGGDSLMIVRMVTQLRKAGVAASPADILRGRTFSGMLARLAELPQAASSPRPPAAAAGPAPMLPAQLRWLESGYADPDHFALAWTFVVPPRTPDGTPVDAGRIEAALHQLARTHEALRTRYQLDPPAADVLPEPPPGLLSIAELPSSADEGTVATALMRCHREHVLSEGRVLAATWLPTQRLLQVAAHHLTLDGLSLSVLADDLEDLLLDRPLRGRRTQPRDYAAALHTWLAGASAATDAATWANLDWSGVRPIPTDRTGLSLLASMEAEVGTLDADQTAALHTAAARLRCSAETLILATVGTALAGYFGPPAVSIDTYHHGRDGEPGGLDLTGAIGYVQCSYPVVLACGPGAAGPRTAVDQLRRLPAARFGFDTLTFGGNAFLAALPSSGIRLNFRGRLNEINARRGHWLRPATMALGGRRSPRQSERNLLLMEADLLATGLSVMIAYSSDRFSAGTITALLSRIMTGLAASVR